MRMLSVIDNIDNKDIMETIELFMQEMKSSGYTNFSSRVRKRRMMKIMVVKKSWRPSSDKLTEKEKQ